MIDLTKRVEAAFAQSGYNLLEADKATIEATITKVDYNVAQRIVAIVEKDFPRQSIEERAVEGPIVQLLKNAAPDIAQNMDDGVNAAISALETALKNAAT